MTSVDVLVVGGGPAGLLAAEATAGRGLATLVVEREAEIGDPVHTSGGTAMATMRDFEIPHECFHPVRRVRFCSPNEETAFEYDEPLMCVLDVRGTYRHLAERARARGAEIRTGARAEAPLLEDGRVVGCVVDGAEIRSRVVVDASGYRAAISKRAGLHPGYTRFGVGSEFELVAPRCDQEEALLVVGERWAPAGYAWVFPWGGERVRVGVGVHHADVRADPKHHLELFRDEAARFGVDLTDARETEYHFGLVPAESMPRRLVADGILAAGDAACQATLVVGEGIRLAMTAGWMAGVAAANALASGRGDRAALLPYEREFRRRYGLNLRVGGIMNRRLARQDDAGWDEKMRLLRLVPRELVPRLLLSEFRLADLAGGLAREPRLWPQVYRYWIRPRLART